MARVFNFNPGPATLPMEVLREAQAEFLDYQDSGMSIIEMSHRSAPYEKINDEARQDLKDLLGTGDDYEVLFMQGGATMQFSLVPLNLIREGRTADYAVTGEFAARAFAQAAQIGAARAAVDLSGEGFRRAPAANELRYSDRQAYLHVTTNNTIFGTAWREYPDFGVKTLVADMSSDFLSRPFDVRQFSLIYAGAQKNIGPAGAAVVVIKKSLLDGANEKLPEYFSYKAHAKNNSLLNTPPVFTVYMIGKILKWLKNKGGLAAMGKLCLQKSSLVYGLIDRYPDFYRGHAEKGSRSLTNVTFRLPDARLDDAFVRQAAAQGLSGVKGHRSVGGIRVSIYNYMPVEGCERLAEFMEDFYLGNRR
ncbi:MAG: 3-phosphoserine/phosphohydroxythreonine transaminase [Acidaminococcales bacterium]|jgi:phosphoserine aminotransferase|nr:3-phosphoserine/phosphohydroxythreonine transaminase [Acidaminococcales bacterium]